MSEIPVHLQLELSRDIERRRALTALLAVADPPAHRRQAYHLTQGRDPFRSPEAIARELGRAYVERRRHEFGRDITRVISVATSPREQRLADIVNIADRRKVR